MIPRPPRALGIALALIIGFSLIGTIYLIRSMPADMPTDGPYPSSPGPRARAAFQAPDEMQEGEIALVEAAAAEDVTPQDIKDVIRALAPGETNSGSDQIETFEIKAVPVFIATLSGIGFKIIPAGPQVRDLQLSESVTWQWQVEAEEISAGTKLLTSGETRFLSLTIEGKLSRDSMASKYFKIIPAHRVYITRKPVNNWEQTMSWLRDLNWAWGAIVLPFFGLVAWLWRKLSPKSEEQKVTLLTDFKKSDANK